MKKFNCGKKYLLIGLLLISAGLFLFPPNNTFADDSLCAVVKIEIRQELTLERQAFDAHMRINNGLSHITLEDVNVTVNFADEYGQTVIASSDPDNTDADFFIRADSDGIGEPVNSIWPIDSVAPSSAVDLYWLIIPAPGSSNDLEKGKLYYVGATLTYTIGGEENITEVSPDYIYVKPLPELQIDYFLTQDVFGDDAFSASIEPPIPFTLGVRVKNNGHGTARNLKIDSAQPEIIENEQGLLIGFAIEGSEVNGLPATESLLVDFGDIPPDTAGVGRWIMTCTLSGKFIEFSADVSHSDELGGELTSLIEGAYSHFLIKDVLVDLPGRDNTCDFLATLNNNPDSEFKVYESDCTDTLVSNQSLSSIFEQNGQSGSEVRYTLSTPESTGFIYVQVNDVNEGNKFLKEVIRSDGKQIKFDNAWLSKTRKEPASSGWNFHINLFDVNTTGSYTFVFDDIVAVPQPPVLMFINEKSRAELQQLSFIVQASDPNNTIPSLSGLDLPPGATFVDNGEGDSVGVAEGIFDWTPALGQAGTYYITFTASDGILETSRSVKITVCSQDDSDCDGMNDEWEILHFEDLTRDGFGDYDGDGISDLDEFLFGTDPTAENGYGPNAPKIVSPSHQGEVDVFSPQFIFENSEDPDGDVLSYEFELFSDPECVDLVSTIQDIVETQDTTLWTISEDLNENTFYYWRVRASDRIAYSLWTYGSFFVNTSNVLPDEFHISSPANETYADTLTPFLEVTNSSDADNDTISYMFEVYSDSSLIQLVASASEIAEDPDGTTGWTVPADSLLNDETTYYWKAIAIDEHGAQVDTLSASFTISTSNSSPTASAILAPEIGSEITSHDLDLTVSNATDADGDFLIYQFELDRVNTFDSPFKVVAGDIEEGVESTPYHVEGLLSNTMYYWRVRANDGMANGPWITSSFFVNPTNDTPFTPTLKNPGKDTWVHTLTPTLCVNSTTDLDNDTLQYRFEVYSDANLINLIEEFECSDPEADIVSDLSDNTRYYWRVRAEDGHGEVSDWMDPETFFVKSYNWPSQAPQITITEPSENLITGADIVVISWEDVDPDSNATISLYYDIDNSEENGILIADNIAEDTDGASDSYVWDVTGPGLEGTWYIYAVISDGQVSVSSYSPGAVTIDRSVPVVTAAPSGGSYTEALSVILSANEVAEIYSTTDGSDPTAASQVYVDSIDITQSTTLKYIGIDSAGNQSDVFTEEYIIAASDYIPVKVFTDEGTPITGVNVFGFTESGAYTGKNANTDDTGAALFTRSDFVDGNYKFRVDYMFNQFWSLVVPVTVAEVEVTIEIEAAEITVTTASGISEGVRVYLFNESGAYLGIFKDTDANGTVSFDLPAEIAFKFRADILGSQYWSDITTIASGDINYIPVAAGGGLFRVTLQEDPATPMDGVRIYLFSGTGSYLGLNQATDSSGRVGFDVPEGSYKVRADYMGYQFWSSETFIDADTSIDLDIVHHDIDITVNSQFDAVNDPIEDICVYLFTSPGTYLNQNKTTDPNGVVTFHLPNQAYKVRADYMSQEFWSDEFTGVDTVVNIPMSDADITVTGEGQPIEGVPVYVFTDTGTYLNLNDATDASGNVMFRLAAGDYKFRTDYQDSQYWSSAGTLIADQAVPIEISTGGGTFTLTVLKGAMDPLVGAECYLFSSTGAYLNMWEVTSSGGLVSFNLADGDYKIRVDHLGYQFWTEIFAVPEILSEAFTILHQDITITVSEAFQAVSNPIEGTAVYLFTSFGTYMNQSQTTDVNGGVVFNLPNQAYKVRADYMSQEFWSDEFTGLDTVVDIPMADAEIMVTRGGEPLDGVQVDVFTASGTYLNINDTTDSVGVVMFHLAAGDYKFRTDYQGSQYWSDVVTLEADQAVPVEISTGGGAFTLTVLKNETEPLVGASCYLFSGTGSYLSMWEATSSEGQVSFNLADAEYKIRVDHLGYQFWTDVFTVPGTLSEVFTIQHQDITVSVEKLYQGTPEALESIKVYLFKSSGIYLSQNQTTNANGNVVFNLPNKGYTVRADYMGYQFWSDEILFADTHVSIPHGMAEVHVLRSGVDAQSARVYLFKAGTYLSWYQDTNISGIVEFLLPENIFRFRADEGGEQVYTPDESIQADMINSIEINMD